MQHMAQKVYRRDHVIWNIWKTVNQRRRQAAQGTDGVAFAGTLQRRTFERPTKGQPCVRCTHGP